MPMFTYLIMHHIETKLQLHIWMEYVLKYVIL